MGRAVFDIKFPHIGDRYEITDSDATGAVCCRTDSASDEILKGLVEQGLLTVSQQANGFSSVDVLEVTDKGQEVEFWNRENGACVGHRVVDEVKEWTEPGNGNQKIVRVSYTWKLADVPAWVDKKAFSSVKGMNEPEESMINLVKTSNGWKAI